MARRSLSRWQKASALVPMAVLVAAWGTALTNTGLASASDTADLGAIPSVPATTFDQPASVQKAPTGIDPRAGADMAVSTLSTNGIPAAALSAYRRADALLGQADKSCNLPWHLVAAIGRVESNHGRINNNKLSSGGTAKPGIFGIALDGKDGTARITDTDQGKLDKDKILDRAVGPMQFIPGTWKSVGVDADDDGTKDPQNINDAATAAGVYLCAGSGDVSKKVDAAAAVGRYNRSASYVKLVLAISEAYRTGDFTSSPGLYTAAPMLTNRSVDQTLTPAQRTTAAKSELTYNSKMESKAKAKKNKKKSSGSSGGTAGTGGTAGSGGTTSTGSTGGGVLPSTGSTGGSGGSGGVKDTVKGTVTDPVTGTVGGTVKKLTSDEADKKCGPLTLANAVTYTACMATYGF